jgi:ATP-binding cassette, subfamily C (CFTR/MRP), member 1
VSIGLTAVSLVQLITFAETIKMLIQWWTSLETSIGAVARIKRFSEETPDENLPGENKPPLANWPLNGEVLVKDATASYGLGSENKALDGISFSVKPGEKVGIVGRTGR